MSHPKEPWALSSPTSQRAVRDEYETDFSLRVTAIDMPDQEHLAGIMVWGDTHKKSEETARRIVACVNACAGIPTDDLERYYNAGGGIDEAMNEASLRDQVRVIQQRDKLLSALEYCRGIFDGYATHHSNKEPPDYVKAVQNETHRTVCEIAIASVKEAA